MRKAIDPSRHAKRYFADRSDFPESKRIANRTAKKEAKRALRHAIAELE